MNAMAGELPPLGGHRSAASHVRGLAWIGGALATLTTAIVGVVLAVMFAATLIVVAVVGSALLLVAGLTLRARRSLRAKDEAVIEARHLGGHSWVAYGWDQRSQ